MVCQVAVHTGLPPVFYKPTNHLLEPPRPVTTPMPSTGWSQRLRQTSLPTELAVLALKTFGVSDAVLEEIYGVEVPATLQAGLAQGRDSTIPTRLADKHDCEPVGIATLRHLVNTPSTTVFHHRRLQAAWELTDKIHTLTWRDGKPWYEPSGERHWHVRSCPDRDRWSEDLRGLFLAKTSNLELLLLLPLPCEQTQAGTWHLLRSETMEDGQCGALRLLAGLSILGLSHRDNLTRTAFLSNLVTACADLFDEVGVCQSKGVDRPHDERLRLQAADGTQGLLLLRQLSQGASVAKPFVLDFSRAWQKHLHRITAWALRDRTGDADEMADALLQPFTHASGVCLQLSLKPRRTEPLEHSVHLLAPADWLEFLHQGHAEKRHKQVFKPYQRVNTPGAKLLHIDAPTPAKYTSDPQRYIREQKKLAEQRKEALDKKQPATGQEAPWGDD